MSTRLHLLFYIWLMLGGAGWAQIVNPGFETGDLTGWGYDSDLLTGVADNEGSNHGGSYGLTCYHEEMTSVTRTFSQSVSGLADGDYYLTAWVGVSDVNNRVWLRADDNGDAGWEAELLITGVSATAGFSHIRYAVPVSVTGGNLDIQFQMVVEPFSWVMADDFELVPAGAYDWREGKNLTYEEGYVRSGSPATPDMTRSWEGWSVDADFIFRYSTDAPHRGGNAILLYKGQAWGPALIYQTLCGVPDGSYYLTCFQRTGGAPNRVNLRAVSGGSTFTTGDYGLTYDWGATALRGYQPVVLPVEITDGMLWIRLELEEQGASGDSLAVDDWDLIAAGEWDPIVNPGFEMQKHGWTFGGTAGPFFEANPAQNHEGVEICKFWDDVPYQGSLNQTLQNVAPGVYDLSCEVFGYAGQTFTLYADNGEQTFQATSEPAETAGNGVWRRLTVANVVVTASGSLGISGEVNATVGGAESAFDAFALTVAGGPAPTAARGWTLY